MQTVLVYGRKMEKSGGVENYIYNTYKRIDKNKFNLILIIPYPEDEFASHMSKYRDIFDEVKFIESHTNNLLKHIQQQYVIYRQHRNAIVHIHASNGFHAINGLIAKLSGLRKVVFHSHNSSGIESLNIKISRYIYRFSGKKFIGCTKEAVEYLFGKSIVRDNNYLIAKNAIDSKKFSFSEYKRKKIRDEFSISNETIFMGFIGRISSEKNVLFLIEIVEEMVNNNYKCKLLIVGDGPDKEIINSSIKKKNLEEYIIMPGARDDISDIMSGLDLLLLPSQYEALGIVLIEAQTSGLKCLASTNVSRDANISNTIEYLNIDKITWFNKIKTMNYDYNRHDYDTLTKESGYDLEDSVLMIESLYDSF